MFFGWEGPERGWGRGGHLFEFECEFEGEGGGVGVGANSRLGAYSNKYGISISAVTLKLISNGQNHIHFWLIQVLKNSMT